MPEVMIQFHEPQKGAFILLENKEKQGEMEFAISPGNIDGTNRMPRLIIHHTEVNPENEGKGYAKLMFQKMIAYARENNLGCLIAHLRKLADLFLFRYVKG
jgi:predicted GNAT family acetyltransferase